MENTILVLPPGGAFAHFFMLHRGVFGWTARPHRGAFAAFLKEKIIITNTRGKGGMGTFGIAWTIIDQTEGQDGWILAEFPFPFLLTETRPIYSHDLIEQARLDQ